MKIFAVVNIKAREAVFASQDPDQAEEYILDERISALKEVNNEAFLYDFDNLDEQELNNLRLGAAGSEAFYLRVFPIKITEGDENVTITDQDGELITLNTQALLALLKETEEEAV